MSDRRRDSSRREAIGELLAVVGTPRTVPVGETLWTAAAVLGGLRQASNDAHRARRRDRGADKNSAGDLQGAVGELLIATLLERGSRGATVTLDALRWEGAADDVDARVRLGGEDFLIETKCHLHEPNKRLFLVNADAAGRSKARGARSFIPVISAMGAAGALIGTPILVETVIKWPERTWRYGDAARLGATERGEPQVLRSRLSDPCVRSSVRSERRSHPSRSSRVRTQLDASSPTCVGSTSS